MNTYLAEKDCKFIDFDKFDEFLNNYEGITLLNQPEGSKENFLNIYQISPLGVTLVYNKTMTGINILLIGDSDKVQGIDEKIKDILKIKAEHTGDNLDFALMTVKF